MRGRGDGKEKKTKGDEEREMTSGKEEEGKYEETIWGYETNSMAVYTAATRAIFLNCFASQLSTIHILFLVFERPL